jgi:poly(3-hydroxybutyrate) depolymerase
MHISFKTFTTILLKGATILITVLSILFIAVCLATLIGLSSRDRTVLTQKYKTYQQGNRVREYLILTPESTDATTKVVVGLHGFGDSARKFAYYTGLHNTVSSKDIVIYPQAIKPTADQRNGWNAEFCCGSGWKQGTDDAKFIIDLVNQTKTELGVESAKVFVTGFSNGAFMTQKLATDYPDQINAIGFMAGSIGTTTKRLEPKSPVPILMLHGEKDTTVPINGGARSSDPDFNWLSLELTKAAWQKVNQSKATTETITYPDDAHIWHDWRILNFWHKKPGASVVIVNFFNSNY